MLLKYFYDEALAHASYMVGCQRSREAVIVDPGRDIEQYLNMAAREGVSIVAVAETHIHADHITGASLLKDRTGAQIVYGSGAQKDVTGADIFLQDGQELRFGNTALKALATPGHTEGCTSYALPGAIFTGDTLFIRGNGRTDFQGGSAAQLFDSVHGKIFTLPEDTVIYPGHDYNGMISSTVAAEKKFNEIIGDIDLL